MNTNKKIILGLICISLVSCNGCGSSQSDSGPGELAAQGFDLPGATQSSITADFSDVAKIVAYSCESDSYAAAGVRYYDDENQIIVAAIDYGANGTYTGFDNYQYDAAGNLLESTSYVGSTEISHGVYSYNNDGYEISYEYTNDGETRGCEYTVDSNGCRLESDCTNTDGDVTHIEYVCDSHGSPVQVDIDGDGTMNQRNVLTYNAQGNVSTETSYLYNDEGDVVTTRFTTFDSQGHQLVDKMDTDADGTYDDCVTQSYNSLGKELSYYHDEGCDGQVEFSGVYTYDAEGNQLTAKTDEDGDGIVDSSTTCAYTTENL